MEAIIKRVLDTFRVYKGSPIVAVTNDKNTRFIQAVICNDGTPMKVNANEVVTVTYERLDGTGKTYSGTVNPDGSVKVPITAWSVEEEGDVWCWITVGNGTNALSTTKIMMDVQYRPNTGGTIATDDPEYDDIMAILARLNTNENNISVNAAGLQKVSEQTSANNKRITNIERRLDESAFITDDSVAYAKDVPDGALPYAEISKIGGMTYKDESTKTLNNAVVTEVESVGVNLIPFPYAESSTTNNGITYTVNNDGSVVANGTATEGNNAVIFLARNIKFQAGTYTFVYNDTPYTGGVLVVMKNGEWLVDVYSSDTITLESGDDITIYLQLVGGVSATNLLLKPRINKGTAALPYTPYVCDTIPIPLSIKILDGYGWGINESLYNYIDFDKNQFVKRVDCVDLGKLDWYYTPEYSRFGGSLPKMAAKRYDNERDCISSLNYNATVYWDIGTEEGYCTSDRLVFVRSFKYTDIDALKSAMSGVMLYYELAEPVITDISDLITHDNFIKVEEGGIVFMKNTNNLDVPSTITYQIKEEAE